MIKFKKYGDSLLNRVFYFYQGCEFHALKIPKYLSYGKLLINFRENSQLCLCLEIRYLPINV